MKRILNMTIIQLDINGFDERSNHKLFRTVIEELTNSGLIRVSSSREKRFIEMLYPFANKFLTDYFKLQKPHRFNLFFPKFI